MPAALNRQQCVLFHNGRQSLLFHKWGRQQWHLPHGGLLYTLPHGLLHLFFSLDGTTLDLRWVVFIVMSVKVLSLPNT